MSNPRIEKMSTQMMTAITATWQDALADLWELDLRTIGGSRYRFCNQMNEKNDAVVFNGQRYEPYPIIADGFELSAQGAGNRPKLTVSNLMGLITGAAEQYNQLVGAVVIRRQTYARFLDAVNFDGGNPKADPAQEIVTKYLIERMVSLTAEVASFELSAPSESDGSVIPARIMLANVCCWQYRGDGCGYTGKPVADRFDMPTSDPVKDDCSKGLLGCRARYGFDAVLPFGGYPSADKVMS